MARQTMVHDADLRLQSGVGAASVGACVTRELCGHWKHEGPCQWPHNTAAVPDRGIVRVRTLYVCAPEEAATLASRIDGALRASKDWHVLSSRTRAVGDAERSLASRLLAGPAA